MIFLKNIILIAIICLGTCCTKTAEDINIVPIPTKINAVGERDFTLSSTQKIGISDQSILPAAEYLNSILSKATGYNLNIEQGAGDIELIIDTNIGVENGYYTLNINADRATITGVDYGAIISGIATLRQLFPIEIERSNSDIALTLPTIEIKDSPKYEWRGIMLDVSRHFYTVDEVKMLLDMMAMYKLNKFHWHITDDQGWRVEIKRYPLLTEKGAWRKFDKHNLECIRQAKLGNRDMAIADDRLKIEGADTLYGGFYTQNQIREVVKYAGVRGIDVIPEVDMPGHFLAAVENYDNIACFKNAGWGRQFSAPICPGKSSAMEFCKRVYDEIFELFPYEYVHLGADEVEKTNWKKCPDCQKRMRDNGLQTQEELQSWFVKDMERYFNANGKKLVGWDEITEGGVSPTAAIMWWRKGHGQSVTNAAKQGNKIIVSTGDYFYFDKDQSPQLLKEFYETEYRPDGVSKSDNEVILGLQGNIWTEWIPSIDRVIYKSFPRFIVLAEKAWSSYENQSWSSFFPRLQSHLEQFNIMGLNYRILDVEGDYPINSFLDTHIVEYSCWDSTVELRYTIDGTTPTTNSTQYISPITISESTNFKIAAFRKCGRRGDIVTTRYNKTGYIPSIDVVDAKEGLDVVWHKYGGESCAEIESAPYVDRYVVDDVSIPQGVKGDVGLVYTGYIEVPEDGIYTFKLTSDDGSILYIADNLVVDNDGRHEAVTIYGQIALSKGKHPIKLNYFDYFGGEIKLDVLNKNSNPLTFPIKYYRK